VEWCCNDTQQNINSLLRLSKNLKYISEKYLNANKEKKHPIYFIFSNSAGADVGLSLMAWAKDYLFGDHHHCHRNRCHPSGR